MDDGVKSMPWQEVLYDIMYEHVASGTPLPEDQRSADWRFFLPQRRWKNALVIGGGWGAVPVALAEMCDRVVVLESDPEKVKMLARRGVNIGNLEPRELPPSWKLHRSAVLYDLISVSVDHPDGLAGVLRFVAGAINERGYLQVQLANRYGFRNVLGLQKSAKHEIGCRRIFKLLHESGYRNVQVYCPLPRVSGVPLFYLPLEHRQSWRSFFQNIFPLFAAVSPEVKRNYRIEYAVAKFCVRLALVLRLEGLAKYIAPGFLVIAQRDPRA
jgi:hypothetical protein